MQLCKLDIKSNVYIYIYTVYQFIFEAEKKIEEKENWKTGKKQTAEIK